jgi:hypothetical protein
MKMGCLKNLNSVWGGGGGGEMNGMEWKNKNIFSFPLFGSLSRREWNGMKIV